jgi:hypothetical protein
MNRNVNSRFAVNPTNINISRSSFNRDQDILTTMNFGKLVPFYVDEVLPGSTLSIDTSVLARLSTPVHPTMGNAFMDVYYFFVPNRLVWEHWTDFMGENNVGPWAPTVEYAVPQVTSGTAGGFYKGSIADYMGIPTNVQNISVNALPFRAYTLIWNQYFRSEAINDFAYLPLNDSSYNIDNFIGELPNQNAFCGLETLPVAKYFDYFTGCLPEPQRGDASRIPINFDDAQIVSDGYLNFSSGFMSNPVGTLNVGDTINANTRNVTLLGSNVSSMGGSLKYSSGLSIQQESNAQITINELRLAFQLQRLLEKDAMGGGRYTSLLLSHFGVQSPDARLQRAEYLGGKRIPININQVLQTSSTDETSPQGNTAAYSLTTDVSSSFTKSFVEHGFVIGVCCLRTEHSYQQGVERMWSRKGRYDYYWPVLANIGEQAVLNKEIYAQGTDDDDGVFGYQEAWAEYRYKPNRISGAFRSNYQQSLDVWHYGDFYESLPTLSPDWLAETKDNVDRTLAVTSEVEDQCICNFYVKNKSVLPMPTYSIPGLIDHN